MADTPAEEEPVFEPDPTEESTSSDTERNLRLAMARLEDQLKAREIQYRAADKALRKLALYLSQRRRWRFLSVRKAERAFQAIADEQLMPAMREADALMRPAWAKSRPSVSTPLPKDLFSKSNERAEMQAVLQKKKRGDSA